jgi:hypothetical protein
MRRSKKKYSPSVSFIPANSGPQSLKREKAVPEQKNWSEDTIRYGDDDALPLRIAQAVEDSPAASSCTATVAQFIKGAGFSDPALMDVIVDDQGTTLWGLHESLSECLALFEGFAVNHKYNPTGKKITQAYMIGFEGCRMTMPIEGSPMITSIKHNPYFGTNEWRRHYTECYPVHNIETVKEEIDAAEELKQKDPKQYRGYPGQVYYYGKTSPIHRFYPVPGYWSAKKWIYIDGKIQEAHSENMDNGFFQSVMLKLIGDPNAWSTNPKYIDSKTGKSSKTVGEEFAENMATNFSGSKKMGGVMALWGLNNASLPEIDAFPSTANADLFLALQDLTTKNITIARRVPPILSNISEGVSLGSGGSEIQKAVELMQSRVTPFQNVLMNYYNKVLLPGMGIKGQVGIQNFQPVTVPIEIDDKIWQELTREERREFIRANMPAYKLIDPIAIAPLPAEGAEPKLDEEGNPLPVEPPAAPPSEALRNLTEQQLNRILSASKKFLTGRMTYDQAKARIMSFGLTAAEADLYLLTNEEDDAADTTALPE